MSVGNREGILVFCAGAILGGIVVWSWLHTPTIGAAKAELWALPEFDYQQFSFADDPGNESVSIIGSLAGDDVGYPVNTMKITCIQRDGICRVADVEEIGNRQLGAINVADWPVVSWTPKTIVAQDSVGKTTYCARNTITIDRQAKTVRYMSVPENAASDFCTKGRKLLGPISVEDWRIANPTQPWERHR